MTKEDANLLQWEYGEALRLLEVKSSTIFGLFGSNQSVSCPWAVSFF